MQKNGRIRPPSSAPVDQVETQKSSRKRISLDKSVLSYIHRIIEKDVPKGVRRNEYFSKLDGGDGQASTPTIKKEKKTRKIILDNNLDSASEKNDLKTNTRVVKRRASEEDGEIVGESDDDARIVENSKKSDDRIVLSDAHRPSKKFRVTPEEKSDSLERNNSSSPERQAVFGGHLRKISISDEEICEKRKRPRSLAKESSKYRAGEKVSSKSRHRKKDVEDGEIAPTTPPRSDDDERFTLFFTKKYVFSNHYPCQFTIDGREFNCTEQYYMYKKAIHFGDTAAAESILAAWDPKIIKNLGRSGNIRGFNEKEWDRPDVGRRYMREANLAKYQQNNDLRARLFRTTGTTLAEANPEDLKWGIGRPMASPLAKSRGTWRGRNWLGEILTSIRDELMANDDD